MPKRSRAAAAAAAQREEEAEQEDSPASDDDSGSEDSLPSDSDESGEEGDESSPSEDEASDKEEMNVEFDFEAPAEIDFLGLKALLTPYLDGATWNAGELCDAIIGQFWCGTVVKADGALDPVGLLTVLSTWYFHEVKKLDCLSDVSKFLASAAPNDAARAAVREAFDAHPSTALLLNDRFLNVPPNVSTALFALLLKDMQQGREDRDLDASEKKALTFTQYLMCTRVWVEQGAETAALSRGLAADSAGGAPKAKRSKGDVREDVKDLPFACTRPEDEYLWRRSTWAFAFPEAGRVSKRHDPKALRLCMMVTHDALVQASQDLFAALGKPDV